MRERFLVKAVTSQRSVVSRRLAVLPLGALLFALCVSAHAQQAKKVPKVGVLVADFASSSTDRIEAFRQGLRDPGYVEGRNIAIEYRFAEGVNNRFPNLAASWCGSM